MEPERNRQSSRQEHRSPLFCWILPTPSWGPGRPSSTGRWFIESYIQMLITPSDFPTSPLSFTSRSASWCLRNHPHSSVGAFKDIIGLKYLSSNRQTIRKFIIWEEKQLCFLFKWDFCSNFCFFRPFSLTWLNFKDKIFLWLKGWDVDLASYGPLLFIWEKMRKAGRGKGSADVCTPCICVGFLQQQLCCCTMSSSHMISTRVRLES